MEEKIQMIETSGAYSVHSGTDAVEVAPVRLQSVESLVHHAMGVVIPAIVDRSGPAANQRFVEFFTANIRNPNTRKAYSLAVNAFLAWCDRAGLPNLAAINPVLVACYVEQMRTKVSAPTVKQHLAAIRVFLDWLVVGGLLPFNPSSSVRGPKHIVTKGLTPVLTAEEARHLLDSIDTGTVKGLRDRALISVMIYSFARINAVLEMRVEDYYTEGRRAWFRLHEKGGKLHSVPAHHQAEQYMDEYLDRANIGHEKKSPLFRSIQHGDCVTDRAVKGNNILRMVKQRAAKAGLPDTTCCHTFRATGITAYLENGGSIEKAQVIASHESPKTTKLYDRTNDAITRDEIERIRI